MSGHRFALLAAIAVVVGSLATSLDRVGAQSPAPDIERGRHIATALAGCADCHGADFAGGRPFPRGGTTVYAANLTSGAGGIGAQTDAQVARALRTGIAPDGSRLLVMPWREYAVLTDADVAALIAYLRSVPPVDRRVAPHPPAAASAPPASSPDQRVLSSGAYLVTIGGCASLAGGESSGGIVAPNISHDGIGSWSFADFQTAMRTGVTPGGHTLARVMPWQTYANMTDGELRTVYDYLQAQSAKTSSAQPD